MRIINVLIDKLMRKENHEEQLKIFDRIRLLLKMKEYKLWFKKSEKWIFKNFDSMKKNKKWVWKEFDLNLWRIHGITKTSWKLIDGIIYE